MAIIAKLERLKNLLYRSSEIVWFTARAKLARRGGRRHDLDGELVVSLTSYPPRFKTLHLTLRTLLAQSVKPDRIVLWIAEGDLDQLPADVKAMPGIEVRTCPDWRSYKKIVGAVEAFPQAYIVTADDDLFYAPDWLEQLASKAEDGVVVAHAVSRFKPNGTGLLPFSDWNGAVTDELARKPSADLFFASGAGVLFSPGSLHADTSKPELFNQLSPHCDDTWLNWMVYRSGAKIKASGQLYGLHAWLGTYKGSLWIDNQQGRMDQHIRVMSEHFGPLHKLKQPTSSR